MKIEEIVYSAEPGQHIGDALREAYIECLKQGCDIVVIHNDKRYRISFTHALRSIGQIKADI